MTNDGGEEGRGIRNDKSKGRESDKATDKRRKENGF
jgi:hypothetical protein